MCPYCIVTRRELQDARCTRGTLYGHSIRGIATSSSSLRDIGVGGRSKTNKGVKVKKQGEKKKK